MKRSVWIVFLLLCLILAGCAPSQTVSDDAGDGLIDLSENVETEPEYGPFDRNILGVVDDSVSRDHFHNTDRETIPNNADNLNWEDFDFYYDIMYDGIPEDVYYPAVKYAEGLWKYDLIIREDSSDGYYFEEMGYSEFAIDYDKEEISITLHPRIANDGYEAWSESDEEVGYEPFDGGFDDEGNLYLYGNDAVLDCLYYYAYSGREYFIGQLWLSEEVFGMFLMTRGQE